LRKNDSVQSRYFTDLVESGAVCTRGCGPVVYKMTFLQLIVYITA